MLVTTATALAVLGFSEWLSYHETMGFFGTHLTERSTNQNVGDMWSVERELTALGERLIWIHLGHAALEVLALVIVLNIFWSKLVLKPIGNILDQMNAMGHSVACGDVVVNRDDELGQMAGELNRLGRKLTATLNHVATGSELSSLALIGQMLIRKVTLAKDQLTVALKEVSQAQTAGLAAPDTAVASLEVVQERLSSLPDLFEEEFRKRLDQLGYEPGLRAEASRTPVTSASENVRVRS
jgi:methyl-accepting chemotaxis protein